MSDLVQVKIVYQIDKMPWYANFQFTIRKLPEWFFLNWPLCSATPHYGPTLNNQYHLSVVTKCFDEISYFISNYLYTILYILHISL